MHSLLNRTTLSAAAVTLLLFTAAHSRATRAAGIGTSAQPATRRVQADGLKKDLNLFATVPLKPKCPPPRGCIVS